MTEILFQKLERILRNSQDIPEGISITSETHLGEGKNSQDLGLGSLELYELVMLLNMNLVKEK